MPSLLITIIAIALVFDFLNGMHDSSNIVATMISSRAMSPRAAMGISAAAHFAGPFLFGVAVATTIGHHVVDPEAINSAVIIAALGGAILWNLITWYFGWPSSTSHALIGGLVGAVVVAEGFVTKFQVPWWVIALSRAAIALGTLTGGWRLIKTLGGKFHKIRPVHGFRSQLTSASIILGAALMGGPVSTTQVVSSSIMGAGSADRVSKVRWTVARDIGAAWALTIPVAALLAAGIYLVVALFL